jgi:NAD(P)-dependent dehydrogenase (short-subunit alcohol dehydrogenase family)
MHISVRCRAEDEALMELAGSVAVVTGGASGIGRALARRFATAGARAVVVADLDTDGARAVAGGLDCEVALGVGLDVTSEEQVRAAADRVEAEAGPIDLWCSNAGIAVGHDSADGLGTGDDWERAWQVHVLAGVHVARVVLPRMVRRGRGHLLVTASAAGLLSELDSAPYTVTKHGTVAMAEWLAIRYGDTGVGFSCLCPQGVRTPLLTGAGTDSATLALGRVLEPDDVADAVVAGLAEGRFLILPHPEVAAYEQRRADDRDRWLAGMRRLRAKLRDLAERSRHGATTRQEGG